MARGFEIVHFSETPDAITRVNVVYLLDRIVSDEQLVSDTAYEITVFGLQPNRESISVEKQLKAAGLTHYLSDIVLTRPEIRQIPETGSNMLVRSGGPFDNRYIIAGIPMFAPFHFAGHHYADIDGVMIATIENVDVITDRLAGRFTDVNGAVVRANPERFRLVDSQLVARPELSIDYSTIGQDFVFSFPLGEKAVDYFQFGFTRAEMHTLKYLKHYYGADLLNPDFGKGHPESYANLTASGEFGSNAVRFQPFLWLAYDGYDSKSFIPWGIVSFRLCELKKNGVSAVIGSSRQYYTRFKRYIDDVYINSVYANTGYGNGGFHYNYSCSI